MLELLLLQDLGQTTMSRKIGLIDYDVMFSRKYEVPNYDLGVTYSFLKKDKNYLVRLVAIAAPKDLSQYDEIYIYKKSKYLPHPSFVIKDYYKLPIREFGAGFVNREIRPFFKETREERPDFTCYNAILRFSMEKPNHPKAWKLKPLTNFSQYQHLKLYEQVGNEYLRKDIPNQKNRKIVIYDDLEVLFNSSIQVDFLKELLSKNVIVCFANLLDISLLKDTNILEWIAVEKNFSSIRKKLFASEIDENIEWLANYLIERKKGFFNIKVLLPQGKTKKYYMNILLYMNYLNNKSNYNMRLRPYSDASTISNYPLVVAAFRFLYQKPFLMSFYEYLFYVGCKTVGVPKELIKTKEDNYDYIMNKYGMPNLIQEIENWLVLYPEDKEFIFIGGSSNYEQIRRKYYDPRRGKIAFGERN